MSLLKCLSMLAFCFSRIKCDISDLKTQFSWKQVGYDFDGFIYEADTNYAVNDGIMKFNTIPEEKDKFFIQYNNIPIGLEVYKNKVFITVPRRRYGIPSTLNYVDISSGTSPLLKPYPEVDWGTRLTSVYRPRVDRCGRLWVVDTGVVEIPNDRKQLRPPALVVFNLDTNELVFRHELTNVLVNERTSAGMTSIAVEVSPHYCEDAFAYINDLATGGLIVVSMAKRESWRIQDPSFTADEAALNFTIAGDLITWRDGLFSITLAPDGQGKTNAYYHAFVSTQEYVVDTQYLNTNDFTGRNQLLGNKGPRTQSGSHDYHPGTKVVLFANQPQDAILCWNVNRPMSPENVAIVAQDPEKLLYISDLKIVGDEVWVLVNKITKFVFSSLNTTETNFYVHRGKVADLIRGTPCDICE